MRRQGRTLLAVLAAGLLLVRAGPAPAAALTAEELMINVERGGCDVSPDRV